MSSNRNDSFESVGEKLHEHHMQGAAAEAEDGMDMSEWNFDPSTLNPLSWSDSNNEIISNQRGEESAQRKRKRKMGSSSSRSQSPAQNASRIEPNNWDGNMVLLSNFVGLEYEGGGGASSRQREEAHMIQREQNDISRRGTHDTSGAQERRFNQPSTVSEAASSIYSVNQGSTQGSVTSAATSGISIFSQGNVTGAQHHPLAIQSFATCPHHSSNGKLETNTGAVGMGLGNHASTDFLAMHGISPEVLASFAASLHNASSDISQNLNSLAANFAFAQGAMHPLPSDEERYEAKRSNPAQDQSGQTRSPTLQAPASTATDRSHQQLQRDPDHSGSNTPPFYLFDAPVELRANFMQNQKRLGLPIHHDPNSYHFGKAVRGFHPQQLMNQQQVAAMVAATASGSELPNRIPNGNVQLIDARHGNIRSYPSGTVKNEREQKRAAKITELIDRIRQDMEEGGWEVEMPSKFHILSKCAEYMKHMIQSTQDKEEAVNNLKSELEIKIRKMEDDKSVQESRSDPESVTSSLTSGTNVSAIHERHSGKHSKGKEAGRKSDNKKRAEGGIVALSRNSSSVSTNEDSSGGGEDRTSGASGSGEPSTQGYSIEQTAMTGVSDLTFSNRASSSNNSGSGDGSGNTETVSPTTAPACDDGACPPSVSSISSDAAVTSQKSSGDHQDTQHSHNLKDVVVDHGKRSLSTRSPEDTLNAKRFCGVNYEEIFSMSNVPQIIATTSGKVVAWNKCFLKATGIRRSEVERMTIFSLVTPDQLSRFFEIVSHVLKVDASSEEVNANSCDAGNTSQKCDEGVTKPDFATMTLPCIDFPSMRRRRDNVPCSSSFGRLYVTVTLMTNVDPKKRCFHCVFSNHPRSDGVLGILSPEFLASIYSAHGHSSKRQKRHRRHSSKKRSGSQANRSSHEIPTAIEHNNGTTCSGEAESEATIMDRT